MLADVAFLGADTSRSRCYMQALAARSLLPCACLLLHRDGPARAGQHDDGRNLEQICAKHAIPCERLPDENVNAAEVVAVLAARKETVFIYSGFGGVILRSEVIGCGKRFLHVHGGWLPDYKGSTTNYYSILQEGICGASAIFLSDRLDSGPLLARKRFAAPEDIRELDHVLDSAYRAEVLGDVLQQYVQTGEWPCVEADRAEGDMYYIMHPLLRHVVICGHGKS